MVKRINFQIETIISSNSSKVYTSTVNELWLKRAKKRYAYISFSFFQFASHIIGHFIYIPHTCGNKNNLKSQATFYNHIILNSSKWKSDSSMWTPGTNVKCNTRFRGIMSF